VLNGLRHPVQSQVSDASFGQSLTPMKGEDMREQANGKETQFHKRLRGLLTWPYKKMALILLFWNCSLTGPYRCSLYSWKALSIDCGERVSRSYRQLAKMTASCIAHTAPCPALGSNLWAAVVIPKLRWSVVPYFFPPLEVN